MRGKKRHRKKAAKKAAKKLKRDRAKILAGYFKDGRLYLPVGAEVVTFQTRHYEGGDIMQELLEYKSPPPDIPAHWLRPPWTPNKWDKDQ